MKVGVRVRLRVRMRVRVAVDKCEVRERVCGLALDVPWIVIAVGISIAS